MKNNESKAIAVILLLAIVAIIVVVIDAASSPRLIDNAEPDTICTLCSQGLAHDEP